MLALSVRTVFTYFFSYIVHYVRGKKKKNLGMSVNRLFHWIYLFLKFFFLMILRIQGKKNRTLFSFETEKKIHVNITPFLFLFFFFSYVGGKIKNQSINHTIKKENLKRTDSTIINNNHLTFTIIRFISIDKQTTKDNNNNN